VFLAKIRDYESCRKLEAKIYGAYPLLGVLIISPKFHLKTPSGLGDPLIESLGRIRGQFSGLSRVPEGGRLTRTLVPSDPVWVWKAQGDLVTCAS
jgi:hypothetical protein